MQRRAAEIFDFRRPNDDQRRAVLEGPLREAGFCPAEIEKIVQKSGSSKSGAIGFTFSDLTQRFLPTLVLDAYPDGPITVHRALELLSRIQPTPAFRDGGAP